MYINIYVKYKELTYICSYIGIIHAYFKENLTNYDPDHI